MRIAFLPFLFVGVHTLAQIPNGGFENWTPSGLGYDQPDGWTTSNSTTWADGELSCAEGTTAPPEGASYAILTSHNVTGVGVVPGTIHTGTPAEMRFPYAQRPIALNAQCKFWMQGGDVSYIHVSFTKWNAIAGQSETIGDGFTYMSGALPVWQLQSIPINYVSAEDPDSAFVEITCSVSTVTDGTYLEVDALVFELSVGLGEAEDGAALHVRSSADGPLLFAHAPIHEVIVTDMSGRMIERIRPEANTVTLRLPQLTGGLYVARARLADGTVAARSFVSP